MVREYQEGVKNCAELMSGVCERQIDMTQKLDFHIEDFRRCTSKNVEIIGTLIDKGDRHSEKIRKLNRARDQDDDDIKRVLTRLSALEDKVKVLEIKVKDQDGS
jgi:hypothetical protein